MVPEWYELSSEERRQLCGRLDLDVSHCVEDFEVTQHLFEKLIEEKTIDPLFVTHCPKELVPLAKQNTSDEAVVDVYELLINGQEISPGYSELNDPDLQRSRLEHQAVARRKSWMKISCGHSNTACLRPAGSASASIA